MQQQDTALLCTTHAPTIDIAGARYLLLQVGLIMDDPPPFPHWVFRDDRPLKQITAALWRIIILGLHITMMIFTIEIAGSWQTLLLHTDDNYTMPRHSDHKACYDC